MKLALMDPTIDLGLAGGKGSLTDCRDETEGEEKCRRETPVIILRFLCWVLCLWALNHCLATLSSSPAAAVVAVQGRLYRLAHG